MRAHGTYSAYNRWGCRCQLCRDFMALKAREKNHSTEAPLRRERAKLSERMPWPVDYSEIQPFGRKSA